VHFDDHGWAKFVAHHALHNKVVMLEAEVVLVCESVVSDVVNVIETVEEKVRVVVAIVFVVVAPHS
jgi:hypothetical protein